MKDAHIYTLRAENHLNDIKTLSNKIERLPSEYDQTNAKLKIKYLEDKLKSQNNFLKHAIEWNKKVS